MGAHEAEVILMIQSVIKVSRAITKKLATAI